MSTIVTRAGKGSALTWTEADANFTNLNTDKAELSALAASTGAALIGSIQTGTGATARTVQDKLRTVFLASDYGAVGDGVTNDTTALNNALTAASGKTLILSPGTYKITSTLTVPASTVVMGYGAILSCTTAQFTGLTLGSAVKVLGLTMIGPASATYNASAIAMSCSGTNNSPAAPTFVTGPIIRDCNISNFGNYGIYLAYVNYGTISNNIIEGIGYAAVGGVSCNDTQVINNQIGTIGPGPANGDAYGIFIDRLNGTSETADPKSYRINISGNKVTNVVATGGVNGQGIDTHGGDDFTINGNRISGCQVGIAVVGSNISSTPSLGAHRVSITGNTINGLSVNYGIVVSGAISGSTVNQYTEQISIVGNDITNHGATNDNLNGAIFVQGVKGVSICDNTIRRPLSHGINMGINAIGMVVTGNTIVDPNDATLTTPSCIRVSGNNCTGLIAGNELVYETAVATYTAVESIRIASSLTGLSIDIGRHGFSGIDATHLTYTEGTSTGVNAADLCVARGRGQVSLTNAASNSLSITFVKRFPVSSPRISLCINGTPVPGTVTKSPQLASNSVTAAGFDIVARPYDLTTFGGSGTLEVDWVATA